MNWSWFGPPELHLLGALQGTQVEADLPCRGGAHLDLAQQRGLHVCRAQVVADVSRELIPTLVEELDMYEMAQTGGQPW